MKGVTFNSHKQTQLSGDGGYWSLLALEDHHGASQQMTAFFVELLVGNVNMNEVTKLFHDHFHLKTLPDGELNGSYL